MYRRQSGYSSDSQGHDSQESSRSRSRHREYRREGPPRDRFVPDGRRRFEFGSWGRNNESERQPLADYNSSAPPFKKNFYAEILNPKQRPMEEILEWRSQHRITVGLENNSSTQGVPNPVLTFEEARFPPQLAQAFTKAGFIEPTPIQAQGWPIALRGNDLIGIAKTGSGKTLAFIIPAFIHLLAQPRSRSGDGPVVLVLAPTRELAVQINEECVKFGAAAGVRVAAVYGGAEKYHQKRALFHGVDIVIATPGRLIDLMETGVTNLSRVTYLVLDEADRMLDMGFEDQIREIVSKIRADRQTLMWSATWPQEVKTLARELCQDAPIKIQVGSQDLAVNDMIAQRIEVMEEEDKKGRLTELLKQFGRKDKVLVFCQTKRGCEQLARTLDRARFPVAALHGDKTQRERDRTMVEFKSGERQILIATDLAARGLDIKDIKCVINFDFPMQIEDYIHRVGRTGRAGAEGLSVTFFTRENGKHAADLIDILEETNQPISQDLIRLSRRRPRAFSKTGINRANSGRRNGDTTSQQQQQNQNHQPQQQQQQQQQSGFAISRSSLPNFQRPTTYTQPVVQAPQQKKANEPPIQRSFVAADEKTLNITRSNGGGGNAVPPPITLATMLNSLQQNSAPIGPPSETKGPSRAAPAPQASRPANNAPAPGKPTLVYAPKPTTAPAPDAESPKNGGKTWALNPTVNNYYQNLVALSVAEKPAQNGKPTAAAQPEAKNVLQTLFDNAQTNPKLYGLAPNASTTFGMVSGVGK